MRKRPFLSANAPCPCGSDRPYTECCGRLHEGLDARPPVHADTPEALMRSRYSAYALGLIDYLLATWHPSTAPGELELFPIKWLGLEIRQAAMAGDAGVVEFVARHRDNSGRAGRLHETSRFVCEAGRWYYIDGQVAEE